MTQQHSKSNEMKEFYSTESIPEEMKQALSFLRQWLNEDRKATPMVTARDLWQWLEKDYKKTKDAEREKAVEEVLEGKYVIDIEDKRYVQNCLATDNRKWIEPQFVKIKDAIERGYIKGHSDGYYEGLKENKIIPAECNPALTPQATSNNTKYEN